MDFNIPEYVFSELQQKYKDNVVKLLKFTGELISLMNLMKQNGIRAISLKGPILGNEIYGDVSLRTSKDLDILIDCKDIEKVEKILLDRGYKKSGVDFPLTVKQRKMIMKRGHHFEYYNSKMKI